MSRRAAEKGRTTYTPGSSGPHYIPRKRVDDNISNVIVAQLLFLESEDPDKDIYIYINSPGGLVTISLAIYDTMQYVKPDVSTIAIGRAASMGALLLSGGAPGKSTRFRIRGYYPPAPRRRSGSGDRHEHTGQEILRIREELAHILARHTGQPLERVHKDTEGTFS